MKPITMLQTACGPVYEQMLAATDERHRSYCSANGVEFQSFIGVRRGFYPWHACYNRIEMLNDLLEAGYDGWVMYLDADAVIRQRNFDLRTFLGKREQHALIATLGSPEAEPWAINDGVFFLNFGHQSGPDIAERWRASFYAHITDQMLREAVTPWRYEDGSPFPGDQHLLQMELRKDDELLATVLHEDTKTMNHRGAKFIRQFLRAHGSPQERLEWIREIALGVEA
jgi:hypothetical protein